MSNPSPSPPTFLTELGTELSRIAREEHARTRRGRRPRSRRTLVLAVAAVLALAGGAGAATDIVPFPELLHPGDGPPPKGGPRFAPREQTASFDLALVRELSVLRRERTPADSMGAAAAYVSGNVAPGSSLRVSAPAPPAGTPHATVTTLPAWILPTMDGSASMHTLSPGATGPGTGFAADAAMLASGRTYMTSNHDLIGLAPNSVRTVSVTLRNGATVRLPVVENVFGARFDQGIATVTIH